VSNTTGIRDSTFLNVNGKDAVYKLVKPLRKIGVPAACIYDFDVIRIDKNNNVRRKGLWNSLFSAINICETNRKQLVEHLVKINSFLQNKMGEKVTFGNFKREILDTNSAELIDSFIEKLSHYGVFIVPYGELEEWLPCFHYDESWTSNALNWIETNDANVGIDGKNIWEFIQKIKRWVEDPDRLGMQNY